ncbi:mechanosensitive ion channel family protein [Haliea sp.]
MNEILALFDMAWPSLLTVVLVVVGVFLARLVALRGPQGTSSILFQLAVWLIVSAGIIALVVVLPVNDETQGQVLSLLGVLLSAIVALASTTFVANAMAGIMLQITRPFYPGDYIRINELFGRVTRRALLNTQIQSEMRDLITLPNLMLVNQPFTVLHREGTIISADVSIGYDEPYTRVQELLLVAGAEAGLAEPFVLVQELLDHAVVYRACGFLEDMKHPLTARSNLRKTILEQLHGNGVEIVSPGFVYQRRVDGEQKVIPEQPTLHTSAADDESTVPEDKIFDMAEEAASLEELRQHREQIHEDLKAGREQLKQAAPEEKAALESQLAQLKHREAWLSERIERQRDSG